MILFLYDVPVIIVLGYLLGWYYSKRGYEKNEFYFFYMCLFTFLFWLNVLLSNITGMKPWFIGGSHVGSVPVLIGVFYVFSYPLFYTWGTRLFQYFWGSTPYQNGLSWPIGVEERARPFKPSWKTGTADEKEM